MIFTEPFKKHFEESHNHLRQNAFRFMEKHILPFALEWEESEGFDSSLVSKAAESGILGVAFPEEWGGGGGDIFHNIVVIEELLKGGATGAVVGINSLEISLPPLLALGTAQQKEQFVRPVLKGDLVAALAITEPDAGSDVAGIKTMAVKQSDGTYLLNGSKAFITSGVCANQYTLLTRTGNDPHGGLTFFVINREMPGFEVSKPLKKTGWRSSDTAMLSLKNVSVPEGHRIGTEGSGFKALMSNFENERLSLAIQGYCIAEIAFNACLRYAHQRQAFGCTINSFQVIKHKLAEMATKVLAAKTMTYSCAAQKHEGNQIRIEAAMCKNFTAKIANEVCYDAVQIHGGMGFMRETLVERLSRDARLLPIGGGTTEIMHEIIAKGLGL